ncbi:MAG TPA: zinc-binding dehydrogenase [Candidatus Thermoplasmatota archaeon]|nr:zinc-binding dehydrogenase [Candidatus Thermoplasmatota archaeon]
MRALGFLEHGDLAKLQLLDLPVPEPGPGEVRVKIAYAALNRLDLFVLKGWKGLELPKPHVGGSDGAGVIDQVGPGVTGWRAGDRVVVFPSLSCGACHHCLRGEVSLCAKHHLIGEHEGGMAKEHAIVPAANLKRVPEGFPLREAAAAALTAVTAWRMMVPRGRLRAGESVLVVGAGGGVNTMALQIAKLAGAAPIFATATSEEKASLAKSLGADHLLPASGEWHKEVMRLTDKRGADLVVDNVGQATWGKSLRAAARGGRIVTVGGTTGYDPPAELNQVMWKQLEIVGSTMGSRAEFETAMDLVFARRLRPVIDSEFPLEEGRAAYERLASGKAAGKVVLRL